jgi:Flp pilus assembly pilin Flp
MNASHIRAFLISEDGDTTMNYGLVIAVVFVICLGLIALVSMATDPQYNNVQHIVNPR